MTAHPICIDFGPIRVEVGADQRLEPVMAELRSWLPAQPPTDRADVRIFLHARPIERRPRGETEWLEKEACAWWDGKAWDAVVHEGRSGAAIEWALHPHQGALVAATKVVPDALTRSAHAHRFGRAGILANAVLYRHLLPAAEMALLNRGATLVHASALVKPSGRGVLILGWGGAGKTSASTSLYLRKGSGWRYMSDDLAIVGSDGTLFRSPVPLNVFPYNTDLLPALDAFVRGQAGVADRLHWTLRRRILGRNRVARRFAPLAAYLGPARATLDDVIELERSDVAVSASRPSDADSIAGQARRVLEHELSRGFSPLRRLCQRHPGLSLPFPAPNEALDMAAGVLRAAFARCHASHLVLPLRTPPNDVGRLVAEIAASD